MIEVLKEKDGKQSRTRVHNKFKDVRTYLNLIVLNDVLVEGISGYQLWTQKTKASAFEREFQKQSCIKNWKF